MVLQLISDKAINGATAYHGMFTAYVNKKGELLLQVTKSNLDVLYLMANRMVSTSENANFNAGEMVGTPFMFSLSADTANVYMHSYQNYERVVPGDPIEKAFNRNFVHPIMKTFKIKASRKDTLLIVLCIQREVHHPHPPECQHTLYQVGLVRRICLQADGSKEL